MFFSNKNSGGKQEAKGVYQTSVSLVANALGIGVAFFATGPAYNLSIDWVLAFSAQHYGPGWDDFIKPFWFTLIGVGMVGVARASITTLFTLGGLALAEKLF